MTRVAFPTLLIAASVALAQPAPAPQGMNVLYDAKSPSSLKNGVPRALVALTKSAVNIARIALKARCHEGRPIEPDNPVFSQAFAAASGAFTRPGAKQTALLYAACAHKDAEGELFVIAVAENQTILQVSLVHVDVVYAALLDAYGVRDVNGNGLSELALVWHSGDGCCGMKRLDLLEFGTSPRGAGALPIEWFQGNGHGIDTDASYAYTVYAARASKPTFVGVEYAARSRVALLPLGRSNLRITRVK